MKMSIYNAFLRSLINKNTFNSIDEILKWISSKNISTNVRIKKITLDECKPWVYNVDFGTIQNSNGSFFKVIGLKGIYEGEIIYEQPIILQDEIGYLGIICKVINGTMYFLMQAKIEPGNINKVQISPTLQATKSNFTQKHGGETPAYLDYFVNASDYGIVMDQLQSEQSSRFYKKRNRNIIILVDGDIDVLDSHMWMTLGQIKELLKIDNLVSMDTRSVISSIPFHKANRVFDQIKDKATYKSIFNDNAFDIVNFYHKINNYKMFNKLIVNFVPLTELEQWKVTQYEIATDKNEEFKVIFCEIEIDGREVRRWRQPLFEAIGKYTLGLFTTIKSEIRYFLVRMTPEIGSFDQVELGPTVQFHSRLQMKSKDSVQALFLEKVQKRARVLYDVNLSEEGGRFYHEVNRNIIIEIHKDEIDYLPDDYLWLDYKTLLYFMEFNNILNIQLRNLISLLEV